MSSEQGVLFVEVQDGVQATALSPFAITITGSREITRDVARWWFEQKLSGWLGSGHTWLTGGARGIDTWATEWLVQRQEICWAVVPFSAADQPVEAQAALRTTSRLIELNLPRTKLSYLQRNHYMVDHSRIVVGFRMRTTGGTFATLQYALRRCPEVHSYYVSN